jgi:hypothetical protein
MLQLDRRMAVRRNGHAGENNNYCLRRCISINRTLQLWTGVAVKSIASESALGEALLQYQMLFLVLRIYPTKLHIHSTRHKALVLPHQLRHQPGLAR